MSTTFLLESGHTVKHNIQVQRRATFFIFVLLWKHHIKRCLLLWLHFSKTIALLFVIFFCVFRYSVRPSFGYDRQIVVDSILILSRGKRRNYMWNTNDSHRDWGSDTQWSAVRYKWKAILVERLKPGPYTNYSFTTKTALVNSQWAGLFIQNVPRWTASMG